MSELKAYCPYANRDGFYHKSEADAFIAEKDAEIERLKEQVREERSMKVDYKISVNDLGNGLIKAYGEIKELKGTIAQLEDDIAYWKTKYLDLKQKELKCKN